MDTPAKYLENRSQHKNDLVKSLMDRITDGVFVLDERGRYILFNQVFARMAATDQPKTRQRAGTSLQLVEQRYAAKEFLRALRGAKTDFVVHPVLKNQGPEAFAVSLHPIESEGARLVLGTLKPAGLPEPGAGSELNSIPVGLAVLREGSIREANQALAEILGADSTAKVEGLSLEKLFQDQTEYLRVRKLLEEEAPARGFTQMDTVWRSLDGERIHVHLRANTIAGSDDLLLAAIDISSRKNAEEETERRRLYLETVLRNAPDAIVTLDAEHRIVEWNPAAEQIFGYTRDEVVGMDPDDLIARGDATTEAKEITRRVLQGMEFPSTETVRYRKDGSPVNVTVSGSPIYSGDRLTGIVAIYKDITEHKELELQLQQAQKLEAIGTLAGGIAHDFNNLLMGIQGRASLMLMDIDDANPHYEHLKSIEEYSRSATELTKQLLGFARSGPVETRPADLNDLILKITGMFGRTRKELGIKTELDSGLDLVDVDPGQIEQVLLNLLVNAWQAMPDGGSITVTTGMTEIDRVKARSLSIGPGRYVWASVRDEGAGMDHATMRRIFDPFFTTKKKDGGTGLGLTSAYSILKRHGGAIEVRSEQGRGSEFVLYIPPSTEKYGASAAGSPRKPLRGAETVLLVDDEDMVAEVGTKLLKSLGYTPIVARSGKEAVEIYREQGGSIDLVILDVIMPDMSGAATYHALADMNPGIRVLLSSGYNADRAAREILKKTRCGFIQKPFDLYGLSVKIREVLDDAPPA
jgi:PAS domain S-box-containing protein